MTSDLIAVERQYEGERCGRSSGYPEEGSPGCPFLIMFDEEVDYTNGTITTRWHCMAFKASLGCGGPYRCPACLATPSVRVLTPEMVEAVEDVAQELYDYGHERCLKVLRAAFGLGE